MSLIFLRVGYNSGHLLVDVFEFKFKFPFFLVTDSHHFLEVRLDLHELLVQASQFLVWFFRGVVHL